MKLRKCRVLRQKNFDEINDLVIFKNIPKEKQMKSEAIYKNNFSAVFCIDDWRAKFNRSDVKGKSLMATSGNRQQGLGRQQG